jgi:hypothetical protein
MPVTPLGDDLFTFTPLITFTPTEPPPFETSDFADETMLFSADWGFARKNGGPMTQFALDRLYSHTDLLNEAQRARDLNIIIDTRVHMLMPGMIPAIGGWHCDAVPRPGGVYGDQPNPHLYDPRVVHHTLTLSQGDTSKTSFIKDPVTVRLPPGERVWTTIHNAIMERKPEMFQAEHGTIVSFDQGTVHKASITTTPGWRFFFRASLYQSTPRNQIRRQVQVYIPHEGHGW